MEFYKKYGINILIVVITSLLFLACAELVLRVFVGFTPRSGEMVPRAIPTRLTLRTSIFEPHYVGELVSKEFNIPITTNALGFREREFEIVELAAQWPYVFLGDSYFFGWGVNQNARISERFSEQLRSQGIETPVVNLSLPGWGTYNHIDILEKFVSQLNPRLVILGFFVGNDFLDNLNVVNAQGNANREDTRFHKVKTTIREFLESSPLLNLLRTALWKLAWFRNFFNKANVTYDRLPLYEREKSPRQDTLYRVTFSAFDTLAEFSRTHNISIIVAIIPDHLQVLSSKLFSAHDFNKPQRMIHDYLNTHQIPTIDLLESFLAADSPESLFWDEDKHWNERGHRFVADVLFQHTVASTHD